MRKLTIILVPDKTSSTRQFTVPRFFLTILWLSSFIFFGFSGFLLFDYSQLRDIRKSYFKMAAENEGLKGEARILVNNLEEVKMSLKQVQDYTAKLRELTRVKVQKVSQRMGIGPLTQKEFLAAQTQPAAGGSDGYMPLGVNMEKLTFKPIFDRLSDLGQEANQNAFELQHLISTLSQQKSLLSSIPSISPVNGWISSDFGIRISPFTGEKTSHMGLDIAAPIGTPILAPADGVVIFTGAKEGFGNFIMIAHGYGIVTCYGHNSSNMVLPGQKVQRGEQVGTVGATGLTTGSHLHYELYVNGKAINPKDSVLGWNGALALY